jgi:hypothetical protein
MNRKFRGRGFLIRLVAGLMLTLLLPAAVIAAPLRYCTGENGHRAIEFVHTNNCPHVATRPNRDMRVHGAHLAGPHCKDKLLLPVVAKFEKRLLAPPDKIRVPGYKVRFSVATHAGRGANTASPIQTSPSHRSDPRVLTLRTVVLLN